MINSIQEQTEVLIVKDFNQKGILVETSDGSECFIFKSKLAKQLIDRLDRYFYIGMEFEANYIIKNSYRYYNTFNYEFKDLFEETEKEILRCVNETIDYLNQNFNTLDNYQSNIVRELILHFGLESFIMSFNEVFIKSSNSTIITNDVLYKIKHYIFNSIKNDHYYEFSNHSLERFISDRALEQLPLFLTKDMFSKFIYNSKVISINDDHLYLKFNNYIFPCVRKRNNFYVVKTVLTEELFYNKNKEKELV